MNVPSRTPLRVKELALEITKDKKSNFDKVKAIEAYLAINYIYNETPGTPPSNVDFVDHFLFDQKQGYCTYYASAMAIMARCIGLPSRFVEGYRVYPLREVPEDGFYEATNYDNAHSWADVYLEGVGWMTFEPTSIFYDNFYLYMDKQRRDNYKKTGADISDPDNFSPEEEIVGDPTPPPDESENTEDINTALPLDTDRPMPSLVPYYADSEVSLNLTPPPDIFNSIFPDMPFLFNTNNPIGRIVLSAIGLIGLLVLWILFIRYRRKKIFSRIASFIPLYAVIALFLRYHKVFVLIYEKPRHSETLIEYCNRISLDKALASIKNGSDIIKQVYKTYLHAAYSSDIISISEKAFMLNFNKDFENISMLKLGAVKYIIYRYLLGLI